MNICKKKLTFDLYSVSVDINKKFKVKSNKIHTSIAVHIIKLEGFQPAEDRAMNSRTLLGCCPHGGIVRHSTGVWLLFRAVLASAPSASDLRSWPHCLRENGQPTRGPYQTSRSPDSPDSGLTLSPQLTLDAPRLQAPPAPASSLSFSSQNAPHLLPLSS